MDTKIIDIIQKLNDKIYENSSDNVKKFILNGGNFVIYSSDGFVNDIKFLGVTVFCSAQEDSQHIENLESELERRIRKLLNTFSEIRLEKAGTF